MFELNGGIDSVMKQKEYQFPIECIASEDINLYLLINFHVQNKQLNLSGNSISIFSKTIN
jgi:hypothetical protein